MPSPTKTPRGLLSGNLPSSPVLGHSQKSTPSTTITEITCQHDPPTAARMPLSVSQATEQDSIQMQCQDGPNSANSGASNPMSIAPKPLLPLASVQRQEDLTTATSVDALDVLRTSCSARSMPSCTTIQSARAPMPSPDTVKAAKLALTRQRCNERRTLLDKKRTSKMQATSARTQTMIPSSATARKNASRDASSKLTALESTATFLVLNAPLICGAVEIGDMAARQKVTFSGVSKLFLYGLTFFLINTPGLRTATGEQEDDVKRDHPTTETDDIHAKVKDLTYLTAGGSHDVWLLTFHPDPLTAHLEQVCQPGSALIQDKVIIRVRRAEDFNPNTIVQVRHEVGVRKFVSSTLGSAVPTPRIHLWDDGSSRETLPFIAEEYIEGESLCHKWRRERPSEEERSAVLAQMAKMLVDLSTPKFGSIGGFDPEVFGPWEMIDASMFIPGRERLRHRKNYFLGPYSTTTDFVKAMFDKEILTFENFVDQDMEENGWTEQYADNWGTPEEFLTYLVDKRKELEEDDGYDEAEHFVICHGDLAGRNIMIGPDGKIAALLDWEWAAVLPVDEIITQIAEQRDHSIDFFCFWEDKDCFPEDQWGPHEGLVQVLDEEKDSCVAELMQHFELEAKRRNWPDDDVRRAIRNYPSRDLQVSRAGMAPHTTINYAAILADMRKTEKQKKSEH